VVSSYTTDKYNVVDTLGMTSNEAKMGHIGYLVGYATNFYIGILDSGHIPKHPVKEKKPETT